MEYDLQRSFELEKWDIEILRFTNEQVITNRKYIIEKLYEVCKRRKSLFSERNTPKSPEGDF